MSDSHEDSQDKGFKVSDKRCVDRDDAEYDNSSHEYDQDIPFNAQRPLPEIDFSTFVLSLCTSAMVHLGETPQPDGQTNKDLPLAKQTIDILGLLKEKTKGNLTHEESKLIEELLYDLRLRYVQAIKGS